MLDVQQRHRRFVCRERRSIEIARECREACDPAIEIFVLCGRDAVERAADWDYGDGLSFRRLPEEFQMLVASRAGAYETPPEYAGRIHPIQLPVSFDEVSASTIRHAIQTGGPWQALVPPAVRDHILAQGLYRAQPPWW